MTNQNHGDGMGSNRKGREAGPLDSWWGLSKGELQQHTQGHSVTHFWLLLQLAPAPYLLSYSCTTLTQETAGGPTSPPCGPYGP